MAYNNDNGDTKTLSAVWTERPNKSGGTSKYFSCTTEIGGKMYTIRIYSNSTYTPESGKHAGQTCCPVRVTRWNKQTKSNSKW